MGLIDAFNKIIEEHGSSTIMAKHRDLFRDQLAAADKKIAALEKENCLLKDDNKRLNADNQNLAENSARLSEVVDSAKKAQGVEKCSEVEKQILQLLYDAPRGMNKNTLFSQLGVSAGDGEYHIDKLSKLWFVKQDIGMMSETPVEITREGRAYLKESS